MFHRTTLDQNGRHEILLIYTAKLREHKKLAEDVDIEELAQSTRNFSGAEIEGLVRSADSTAMNRIIAVRNPRESEGDNHIFHRRFFLMMLQGKNKIEVSAEDAAKLRISKADFDNALLHDVKPAYGVSEEEFDRYIRSGLLNNIRDAPFSNKRWKQLHFFPSRHHRMGEARTRDS